MKRIIRYLKKLQDRRLRRFCIKCATKACQGSGHSVYYEAHYLYKFLTTVMKFHSPHSDTFHLLAILFLSLAIIILSCQLISMKRQLRQQPSPATVQPWR